MLNLRCIINLTNIRERCMGEDKNSRLGMRSYLKFYSSYLAKRVVSLSDTRLGWNLGWIKIKWKLLDSNKNSSIFELLSKSPN